MSRQRVEASSAALAHWSSPDGDPPTIVEGEGCYVTDDEDEEYLDFIAQLYCVNAGHGNERINEAIEQQLSRVAYVSSAKHNDTREELANELAGIAPGRLSNTFFSISGSEANEAAVQIAREYTGAPKVLTRYQSYHGGTYGAGNLTGDPSTRAALEPYGGTSTGKFLPPLPEVFDAEGEELAERAANHLEYVIRNEGMETVAAVLMEPVGGTSGAYPAPEGYFERVREICDEYGILLIADEVITGFGRCGEWFGIQTEGVEPDVLTFAKGVTSAYAPLAGVLVGPEIARNVREGGYDLGQTFGGHPVSCAAGLGALKVYRDGLLENVRDLAPTFERELRDLEQYDAVADVRGRGFLWGVTFREGDEPFVDPWVDPDAENPVETVVEEAAKRNVLVGTGRPATQVICAPPLCAGREEIAAGVDALGEAIEVAFGRNDENA
ncbi:aspartate aminotransferase family protein [Halalkalicoccus sp. NIPERK01]|uniref:aminotransferase family protein n=1 Tax=Halalkalicoccus sp. NIPERK01 TaxID=3053469 RepID=UPI00256F336F|nr:aspartate aminotransferase family protein [Halalkalicoccus sp. NIPERK01]MDL5362056.1 aspartate aminotransferase family protein [Halalkalicoccus sp. NIPERK01]